MDKRLKEICEEFGFRIEHHGLGIGWVGYYGTLSMIALGYNCYVVYNAEGEVVEEGTVPASGTRYHWSPNITLDNGWYTSFFKPGREAFYVTNGTSMNFSYTLNRSAKIKWQYVKCTSPDVSTGSTWKSGTKTAKSGSIVKTADSTKWYYVGVTNASSDPITITSVDFTF